MTRIIRLLILLMLIAAHVQAMETPIQRENIDPEATAEWVDGQINSDIEFHPRHNDPTWIIWTQKSGPGHSGIKFGISDEPGVRHFRLGFKRPVTMGTVFARGGGQISVLKPEASYPGDMNEDDDWIKATRIYEGEYSLWILPPGTETRAMRFSTDDRGDMKTTFQGHISGIYVLEERIINIAPEANIVSRSNEDRVRYLTDHRRGGWHGVWENEWDERREVVSEENPESLLLLWPQEVSIEGLCALWAGFSELKVEAYSGPATTHPREAPAEQWDTLGEYEISHQYPRRFAPNWIDFERKVTTNAIRLTILKASPTEGVHAHVDDKPREGKRVWLGELMALHDIGDGPAELPDAVQQEAEKEHPPIPVRFQLDRPGYVTLVIENDEGRRVRNLISAEHFDAGQHTVWWDGQKEEAVNRRVHGIYDSRGKLVEPGTYNVRGIYREDVKMRYQLAPYSPGNPPWHSPDGTGGWLADHSPPWDALYVPEGRSGAPEILLTAYVVEHGDGLIGVNLDGEKQWGIRRLGGAWTGGSHLARDDGPEANNDVIAYVGSWWSSQGDKGEVRLTALLRNGEQKVVAKHQMPSKSKARLGGLAVWNDRIVVSLPEVGHILVINASTGEIEDTINMKNAGSLAFDTDGRLLILQNAQLKRYRLTESPAELEDERTVIQNNLVAPQRISVGADGSLYVSDWGDQHQVKVFSRDGRFLRNVGQPGGPQVGPYNPERMHHPCGLAVTPDGRLWVAERDKTPKRVSVWNGRGEFDRAFYGPPKYGGGGTLDPGDAKQFYYAAGGKAGLEFQIDWENRSWDLTDIYYRASEAGLTIPCGHHARPVAPEQAFRYAGKHYMTNAFNSNPTSAPTLIGVWMMDEGRARPVAVVGAATKWDVLKDERFAGRLPDGFEWGQKGKARKLFFAWSDLNYDEELQPEEVSFKLLESSNVGQGYIRPDLTVTFTYTDRLSPRDITEEGVPVYHASDVQRAVKGDVPAGFTSGSRAALDTGEWIVRMGGPIRGYKDGKLRWTYPNQWPGLHASHRAPTPQHSGQIIGTTRLLGFPVVPEQSDVGPIWAVNGNFGNVYLMTADGMFVATLGRDQRTAPTWKFMEAEPGMIIEDVSFVTEHFWPTINQTPDGNVYLVAGKGHCGILRIEGLNTLRRMPPRELNLTPEIIKDAEAYVARVEQQRINQRGRKTLQILLRDQPPTIDGHLMDWDGAHWVRIGEYVRRHKTLKADAAVAIGDDKLYAAFRTGSRNLLQNAGGSWKTLFKSGGALDLKIGTDPDADTDRQDPVKGDLRLLVTEVEGTTKAVLYRPVMPGADDETTTTFHSPWRQVTFDLVQDVSSEVQLAGENGNYELSVPLETLGLEPHEGMIRGDLGILRGNQGRTNHRLYWHNKSTGIISDIPGEAMLQPHLWGRWKFTTEHE